MAKTRVGQLILSAIEWVFITPRLHHTHHGWGKDGKSYRNFSVMLTLYDRLFGTLHVPESRPANYGIPGRDKHWSEEIFFPFVHIRKRLAAEAKNETCSTAADV